MELPKPSSGREEFVAGYEDNAVSKRWTGKNPLDAKKQEDLLTRAQYEAHKEVDALAYQHLSIKTNDHERALDAFLSACKQIPYRFWKEWREQFAPYWLTMPEFEAALLFERLYITLEIGVSAIESRLKVNGEWPNLEQRIQYHADVFRKAVLRTTGSNNPTAEGWHADQKPVEPPIEEDAPGNDNRKATKLPREEVRRGAQTKTLSEADQSMFELVGKNNFETRTNQEIVKLFKIRFRDELKATNLEAIRCQLKRIRIHFGFASSSAIKKNGQNPISLSVKSRSV